MKIEATDFLQLGDLGQVVIVREQLRVEIARDAHCSWVPVHLGVHLTKQTLDIICAEPGSDMRHTGLYITQGEEHLDLFTTDLHEAGNTTGKPPDYAWTDLTYLLHRYHVSWRYYVDKGNQPDCADNAMFCAPVPQNAQTPGVYNPLPYFDTVRQDHQLGDIAPLRALFKDLRHNSLPAVSWIVPSQKVSDHPPALITTSQAYVT